MVVNERPSKRMKRRVTADLYDFLTFPAAADASSCEPFRNCVQRFLSDNARITFPPSLFPSLMTWQILFRVGDLVEGPDLSPAMVTLDIVEEDVTRSRTSVYCDQCRVVGWSGHPVCRKRYHFIIRAASNAVEAYQRPCSRCGNLVQLSETRCRSCTFAITVDDLEDWVYLQIEDNTHLLHGVVHSNGYGHLLTLNGREGGSKLLSGSDIMDFWDRLCAAISVRKVSVMDLSKKFGLEYRLLHAVTNGHSWYGNWGYEFGSGSYALTQDAYKNAVNTLSSMPLSSFSFHGRGPRTRLECVISLYHSLAETELVTIKDLFSFLLTLIHECRKPTSTRTSCTSNLLCAWTGNDVEEVQHALIKVLLASGAYTEAKWVTRRALKGAVSRGVSSPELLDYCFKHLPGKLAANGMVVCSRCNPISSAIEFSLEPPRNGLRANLSYPTEEQMTSDLTFLFDSIIHPEKMVYYRPKIMRKRVADSARKLLDCKQFMKDYKPYEMAVELPSVIRLWCHVELSDQPKDDPSPPPELIVLPLNATVGDLKSEATSAFQEVYAMYKRFQAEDLLGYGAINDSLTVKFLLGTSGSIQIQGKCPAKHGLSRFRMERGTEVWKVDCTCGAKDDDGEKMLACDTCGVWQHTRCAGIDNPDGMPSKFVCMRCVNLFREETKKLPVSGEETKETCILNTYCRDEAVTKDCATVSCNIAVNFGVR
ncbi:PHD finger protein At1g33420 [Cajanus cajan]|uniref:PHD finger protein At1g33420 family n=1 Tax=Cajanus cajan TaxID=3821 RepID=A0A151TNX9_CAJCA|nr:PHD finger protein At1g33420 [Cajanus cajan]KYP68775.1 PHD finger protein At1g33420 family [Cajanus cajan]